MHKYFYIGGILLSAMIACSNSNSSQINTNDKSNTSAETLEPGAALQIGLKEVATNLNSPIGMVDASDATTKRFLIAEQGGLIKVLENGKILSQSFLDLKNKMVKLNAFYDERGLLGLALHPNYSENGLFYVYYSAASSLKGSNHKSVLAEYSVSANKNIANTNGRVIMEIEQPESNHNGGQLAFGKDGFLYIALGDGGGADDKHGKIGNGQNLNTLLGKILRIDVATKPYSIPKDNPFVGRADSKPEIYAYGLRNPWRFSFDKQTGKLFCADVGQNEWEEINIIEKGGNYGWRIMEAKHCFNPASNCNQKGLILPVHEYSHDVGVSVTGGFVYRGTAVASLYGKYIFADWTGPMFYLQENGKNWVSGNIDIQNKPEDLRILSFAEDKQGELYILTSREVTPKSFTGSVYKITSR